MSYTRTWYITSNIGSEISEYQKTNTIWNIMYCVYYYHVQAPANLVISWFLSTMNIYIYT